MSVGGVATLTAVRIKQLSTSVFVKFARRLSKIDFIHRNRRVLVICLIIWLAVNVAGFFVYRNAVTRASNALYEHFQQLRISRRKAGLSFWKKMSWQ